MKIESSDGKSTELTHQIMTFSIQNRIQRSIKSFVIGLGLAILSIAIPGLHFFLVPGFLIFAFYSAYLRYNEIGSLNMTGSKCPICNKLLAEKKLNIKALPVRLYCYDCRSQLSLVQK